MNGASHPRAQLLRVELPGLVVTESLRSPGLRVAKHSSARTKVGLVLGGRFLETVGGTTYEVSPLSMVVRPQGESHSNDYRATGARWLFLEVAPERLAALRRVSTILERPAHVRGGPLPALVPRFHHELGVRDDATPLVLESLFLEMLGYATRERTERGIGNETPRWLREARDLVRDRFSESLRLGDVAAAVGVHPSHLARAFRRRYRTTVGDYLRRLRLDHAASELSGSDRTIADIALASGFFDQSHLTRQFKLRFGLTPSELRGLARAGKAGTTERRRYKTET